MAGAASIANGKKGGRPVGSKASHTIETEAAKKKIVEMVNQNIEEITAPQIAKAKKGDTRAYEALMDRAHGRPSQQVEVKGDIKLKLDV